jgi:hypothetical protein
MENQFGVVPRVSPTNTDLKEQPERPPTSPDLIDAVASIKRRLEVAENKIRDLVTDRLLGPLGIKSALKIENEIKLTKRKAIDVFRALKNGIIDLENDYKTTYGLTEIYIKENDSFMIAQDSIKQDEIHAEQIRESILIKQNQIILDQLEHERFLTVIAAKKKEYFETYDKKLV